MSKEFKMGFIEEVEPLKLTTIPKKYQKLIEATENRWFNKMQKLAKICQKRIDDLEHRLSNCIEPKFKIGQEVWEIREKQKIRKWEIIQISITPTDGKLCEVYSLKSDDTDGYNCCIIPFENHKFFATEAEAKAKLEEVKK